MHGIRSFIDPSKIWSLVFLVSIFTSIKSTAQDIPDEELQSLFDLAYSQMKADEYYEGLKTIYELQEIATKKKLENYNAYANHLFGLSYLHHYAYEKAETHFNEAIATFKAQNDDFRQSVAYASLIQLYVLSKDYDKYNTHISKAKALERKVNDYNRLYYYETEVMRLYDLKKYDSLIYVSKQALHDIKNDVYPVGTYLNNNKPDAYKNRLKITYQLFLAYGLMEKNIEQENTYKLLNKLEKINLEDILWYSFKIFEHSSRIHQYKELYHIRQPYIDKDSVFYYKSSAAKFTEKANFLLKEKSAENNQYVVSSISKEEELKRIQIINKNQTSENALIKKINYLFISLSIVTFFFLVYFYSSSKKLNQTNIDLKKLQADSNKFLGIVSHEIRTPLYALEELVTKVIGEIKPKNSDDVGHINHSILNLRHAIDNSLQFSRFNYFALNIDVNNRPVNLLELINEIQPYFRNVLELHQCNIEIRHELQNENFFLNEVKLDIVLRNILKNAIEAPDVSKIIFEIQEHVISEDCSKIVFSIKDNGHGIPQKTLDDIEQKSISIPDENQKKGIRLGLILCNQILALYNTKLSFYKTKKFHEVSFSILLQRMINKTVKSSTEALKHTDSKRILFVDDNKVNLLITKKIIENLALECDIVDNGHDAIEKVATENYSLILMDLNMPNIDGFETTKIIKKQHPSLPVIAHTALSPDLVAARCREVGMYDILTKPMQKNKLKRILKDLLILQN
ncbi:MAG: response regulator [Flavobacteriaceae bacterium]|nr:response regulator [Flavobacteriaceae bacterium]